MRSATDDAIVPFPARGDRIGSIEDAGFARASVGSEVGVAFSVLFASKDSPEHTTVPGCTTDHTVDPLGLVAMFAACGVAPAVVVERI
jgi:hypothetical protein